jgi:hypothetical protein
VGSLLLALIVISDARGGLRKALAACFAGQLAALQGPLPAIRDGRAGGAQDQLPAAHPETARAAVDHAL